MADNESALFSELVTETLLKHDITLQRLANELCLPERGILFSEQAVANWRYQKAKPGVLRLRDVALFGATPLARQFGRDGLRIYGLQVIEEAK